MGESNEDKMVDAFVEWCETHPEASVEELAAYTLFIHGAYHPKDGANN